MRSWAQRTARWTAKTLPFTFGRTGGDIAGTTPAGQCPPRASAHGQRHRPMHERAGTAPARGRHAAPSRSRKARVRDAG
jgi:hypothetical protein